MRAYLVRNPDRNPDRNIFLRSILDRFLVRYIILRFILWSILDRKSFTLVTLRSILDRFLVRKWDDVIDGGLSAGTEIKGDPAGLPQFFPCPFDRGRRQTAFESDQGIGNRQGFPPLCLVRDLHQGPPEANGIGRHGVSIYPVVKSIQLADVVHGSHHLSSFTFRLLPFRFAGNLHFPFAQELRPHRAPEPLCPHSPFRSAHPGYQCSGFPWDPGCS